MNPLGGLPDLPVGGAVNLVFEVKNLASSAMTFTIQASDDRGYITGVTPSTVTLAAGASRNVTVALRIPATEVAGTSDTVTVVATSTSNPAITNFAVVSPFVIGGCAASDTTLCLGGGHFKVQARWRDFSGNSGSGKVVPGGSADSGVFWFFNSTNWELLIKVLDGCGLNERYWVFAAATTNVEFTLDITDTRTGVVKTYFNPLGHRADSITDTGALATCGAGFAGGSEPSRVRLDRPQDHPGLTVSSERPSWAELPRVEPVAAAPAPLPAVKSGGKPGLHPASAGDGSTCVAQSISCNSTRTGVLTTDDCSLEDGTFYDFFAFDAAAGTDIVATLTSADFDTFLYLLNPASVTVETDDDSGEGTNSRLEYHLDSSERALIFPEQRCLDIRSPEQICPAALPPLPPPATVSEPLSKTADGPLPLSDEAIRIALDNCQVVRILAGIWPWPPVVRSMIRR